MFAVLELRTLLHGVIMSSQSLKVFIGYDHRQPISLAVLQHSIFTRSSKPVSITPLVLDQLPIERRGLTPFTFSRFLVPWLCEYKGWALFLDADMLVLDDIAKLFKLKDEEKAIHVIKNPKRFEWASVMLFNCEKCQILTPEFVEKADGLHTIDWVSENFIGDLPTSWNHLVGYDEPRNDASLIHYTQGVPCFPETSDSEHAPVWVQEHKHMNSAHPWVELMGKSVHAFKTNDGQILPKYKMKDYQVAAK